MIRTRYRHVRIGAQNCRMRPRNDQACAEKLFLLGEMLATASEYLTQCGDVMNCEDSLMLGLAADEVPSLRLCCIELSKDLAGFEKRVRDRIKVA
jgi:hypothetical protein